MAKHHYVPAFYLKKFCDINVPDGQEPYLWTAPRSGGDWSRRAPKNVGFETNLYSVTTPEGEKSDAIEQAFSKIETEVAKLYRDRLDRFEMPKTGQERATLAQFVALFAVRSPLNRTLLTDFVGRVGTMHRSLLAQRPEILERQMRERDAKEGRESKLTAEQIAKLLRGEGVNWGVNQEYITQLAVGNLDFIAQVIFGMRWKFLIAPWGHYFVTADSPAYWQDLTPRPPMLQGHGLAMPNVEVILPLSRKLCFLARRRRSTGVVVATPEQVMEISNRTIMWSTQEVFSSEPFKRSDQKDWKSQPIYPYPSEP